MIYFKFYKLKELLKLFIFYHFLYLSYHINFVFLL